MFGLFAFFYAVLHFSTYLVFDHFFDLLLIIDDVAERKYVTAGFVGFVLMIPLAVTSTQGWIRRLGKRWTALHRLVYVSAVAGVVHFLWLVKIDIGEPLIYAAVLTLLLGLRMAFRHRGQGRAVRRAGAVDSGAVRGSMKQQRRPAPRTAEDRQRTARSCSGRLAGRPTRSTAGAVPATWEAT